MKKIIKKIKKNDDIDIMPVFTGKGMSALPLMDTTYEIYFEDGSIIERDTLYLDGEDLKVGDEIFVYEDYFLSRYELSEKELSREKIAEVFAPIVSVLLIGAVVYAILSFIFCWDYQQKTSGEPEVFIVFRRIIFRGLRRFPD